MQRVFVLLCLVFISSCAGAHRAGPAVDSSSILFIQGVVESVSGNEVVLRLQLPEFKKTDTAVQELASKVVEKSLLLEGIRTEMNGEPALVREARGTTVVLQLERPYGGAAGSIVRLKVPKKAIAVVDFEVIRGREKEAGRVTLEGMTTALIDSGHFTVIERTKLQAVLTEIGLSMTGLTKEPAEKIAGNLLVADLILTGTLAQQGTVWDTNLRLVNVRTGQAMAAVSAQMKMSALSDIRDTGALEEDFEGNSISPSWHTGHHARGAFRVTHDTTSGADSSSRSFRMDYDLQAIPREVAFARIDNRLKRDVSLYSGIEFSVKASAESSGAFRMLISDREDANMMDAWGATFEMGPEWRTVRIPFSEMVVHRAWIKEGAQRYGAKPGKQIFDPTRVEGIAVGIPKHLNPVQKGSMWIDNVRFYSE